MVSASDIIVRRLRFAIPAEIDPLLVPEHPEESYMNVALSLLLPYLEPYLIRSMRAARKLIRDPRLLEDLDRFNAQEGQHYRQHTLFNAAIRRDGFPGLAALEAELDADYRRFTEARSLRFNLAYAEGFEAYTSAVARFSLNHGMAERLQPVARELFTWHLMEEIEHRTVAFDVYQHVCGGYFYRVVIGLYAQWHLNRFVNRVINHMVRADEPAFRARWGGQRAAWKRLGPFLSLVVRKLLPDVLATLLPWYSPHRVPVPAKLRALADSYTARAASTGEPTFAADDQGQGTRVET